MGLALGLSWVILTAVNWESTFRYFPNLTTLGILGLYGPLLAAMIAALGFVALSSIKWIIKTVIRVLRRETFLWSVKLPTRVFLILYALLIGIVCIGFDYRAVSQREPFTLEMLAVSVGGVILVVFGMGALNNTPTDSELAALTIFFIVSPIGAVIGGLYFLSGASALPYQAQIGDLLIAVGNNMPLLYLWLMVVGFAETYVAKLLRQKKSHDASQR